MAHTPHTEKYKCTQMHAHTDTNTILHLTLFWIIWHTCKDANFTFGWPHTHTKTHRLMHTYRYRYHFYSLQFLAHLACMPKIFGIPQNYTCTGTQTCTHIDTHMYTDINTQIQIHRDTCMFVYIHKHTHNTTDDHVENLRKLLLEVHF